MHRKRNDGTCWTCAKPHCFGALGHTVGRVGYALRSIRLAEPRTTAARLRLAWHDLIVHALLHKGGERCEDCGRAYPLWFADDDDWRRTLGGPGGLLCPTCFIARGGQAAHRRGVGATPDLIPASSWLWPAPGVKVWECPTPRCDLLLPPDKTPHPLPHVGRDMKPFYTDDACDFDHPHPQHPCGRKVRAPGGPT